MINQTNLLYSMASAARILAKSIGIIFKTVQSIKILKNCIQVTYSTIFGRCSTFLSFKTFKSHFVEKRKEEAETFTVERCSGEKAKFKVFNKKKGTSYVCECWTDHVDCTCEDYYNQQQFLGKACCKHNYAVLKFLGFNSLSDYIETHIWAT